jgi:hypothetical protein
MHTKVWYGNLNGRYCVRDKGINGSKPLEYTLNKEDKGVDWVQLAHDRIHWRVTVDTVMNPRIR